MSCYTPVVGAFIIFLILLSGLIGSLFPLFSNYNTDPRFTAYGNALSAGFLIATALVHLFPEASQPLHDAFPNFPISGIMVMLGILSVFGIENIVRRKLTSSSNSNHSNSATNAVIAIVLAITLSFHSFIEGLALGAALKSPKRFIAISTAILGHKFFAALTLGNSLASAVDISTTKQSKISAIMAAVMFSIVTPFGAIVGFTVVENWTSGKHSLFVPMLDCVSAGVFLYIGLVEVLANEFGEDSHDHFIMPTQSYGSVVDSHSEQTQQKVIEDDDFTANKATAFVAAAVLMSGLAIFT